MKEVCWLGKVSSSEKCARNMNVSCRMWEDGRGPGSRASSGRGSSASGSLRTSSRNARGPLCYQQQQNHHKPEKEAQQPNTPSPHLMSYQRTSLRSHIDNVSWMGEKHLCWLLCERVLGNFQNMVELRSHDVLKNL